MTSVCLCMIVLDETEFLPGLIESCRPHIDHWVICDTGSTDGTLELIRRELAGIPGELHEHEWVDFGHNRSRLLALAHGTADYLLLLDADQSIEVAPGAFDRLAADSYMVRHVHGAMELHNKHLVSGRIPWRYVGVAHEYITSEQERTCERLEGLTIHVRSVGGARTGRWQRDAALLEAEIARRPDDARSVFYLAQTYRDMAGESGDRALLGRACDLYRRRAGMEGWVEETYSAWHHVGVLTGQLGDWGAAMEALMTAWEVRPRRLEAVYDLAAGLRTRGQYRAAHQFSRVAEKLEPLKMPDDSLFVAPWVYRWGLLFEYSITSYWVGQYARSIAACEKLLTLPDLPETHREQTRRNRRFAVDKRAESLARRARLPR